MWEVVMTTIASLMVSLTAILAMVWFIFGIIDSIANWKHRKDLNRNVRKENHKEYTRTYNKLIESVENNSIDEEALIGMLALINSPSGRIKLSKIKKRFFNKDIILNQLKYLDELEDDFNLNAKLKLSDLLKKLKITDIELNSENVRELLILVATAVFTEQIKLLKYPNNYDSLMKKVINFNNIPKKDILAILKYM